MDELLILAVIVLLAVPIVILMLIIGHFNLRGKIQLLDRQVRQLHQDNLKIETDFRLLREEGGTAPVTPSVAMAATAPDPVVVASKPQAAPPVDDIPIQFRDEVPPQQVTKPVPAKSDDYITRIPDQNAPIVMKSDNFARLIGWAQANWVYVVSALSLALAGIFFVQYGIEKGLLPPAVRVAMAILFGAVLIIAGEWVRRRYGDDLASNTAYLPSVFSGAGLVSIFAGIIAGRQMYALYGYEAAFVGLFATSVLAVVLGWRHGPLLVATGLLGAALAPFVVAGPGGAEAWLYAYFALITATGLAVDAVRRWAWVSVLALVLGYLGGSLNYMGDAGTAGWVVMLVGMALLSVALPVLRLVPDHQGSTTLEWLSGRTKEWPIFPTRLAMGAGLTSSLALLFMLGLPAAESLLVYAALFGLALAYLFWADKAKGLADLALIPLGVFVIRLGAEASGRDALVREFAAQAVALRAPESTAPWTVTALLILAALLSGAAILRALSRGAFQRVYGIAAVLIAPLSVFIFEFMWNPSPVLGTYGWALHVMAVAALMVLFALRFARADGADHRRMAYATLAALSLIALAMFLLATKAALTLALAALVVATAALDRRFRLPELAWFLQLGVAVLGWRLVVDPGLDWSHYAPLPDVCLTFIGVIFALGAALWQLKPMARILPKAVLESAIAGFTALFANVLLIRWMDARFDFDWAQAHWSLTLNAMPWLILMLVQFHRAGKGGAVHALRFTLGMVAGAMGVLGVLAAVTVANPLAAWGTEDLPGLVYGPSPLDTMLLAYALPGLMLLVAAWKMPSLHPLLRQGFIAAGVVLIGLYTVLEIRRFWQGPFLGAANVTQPELYSYTVALMLLGAGLLYQSIAKRSALLRRIAMGVIAITIAKVFLLDASGLTGLVRVVSFLGLGLSLAGLAWLNRWAASAVLGEK